MPIQLGQLLVRAGSKQVPGRGNETKQTSFLFSAPEVAIFVNWTPRCTSYTEVSRHFQTYLSYRPEDNNPNVYSEL